MAHHPDNSNIPEPPDDSDSDASQQSQNNQPDQQFSSPDGNNQSGQYGQYGQASQYGQYSQPGQQGQYNQPGQFSQPGAEYRYGAAPQQPQNAHNPYSSGADQYQQFPNNQQYQQPQQYPQQPVLGGPVNTNQGPSMPRPKNLNTAYYLILAAGALFVLFNVVTAFLPNMGLPQEQVNQMQQMYDDVLEDSGSGESIDFEETLNAAQIPMVIFTLILGAVYWLIARGIRNGSNVARIFGTILAVFSLPSLLGLSFIYVALGVAGIVLAYTGNSSEYFRYKTWEKNQMLNRPR